jgi:hypothetical protein
MCTTSSGSRLPQPQSVIGDGLDRSCSDDSGNAVSRADAMLDMALEDSFPASDPPALVSPNIYLR